MESFFTFALKISGPDKPDRRDESDRPEKHDGPDGPDEPDGPEGPDEPNGPDEPDELFFYKLFSKFLFRNIFLRTFQARQAHQARQACLAHQAHH